MWRSHGYWGYGAGWEGWLMLLFMIVFLVAIVASIVFLTRYFGPAQPMPPQAGGSDSPEVLLKRRYAGGEIDRDEYLQKLDDL